MSSIDCLISRIETLLVQEDSLKAVWLDVKEHQVSFAYQETVRVEGIELELKDILKGIDPGQVPICITDINKQASCELCICDNHSATRPGIRLVAMPSAGLMIEKETCPTSPRFWHWKQFAWAAKGKGRIEKQKSHASAEGSEWKQAMVAALLCGLFAMLAYACNRFPASVPLPSWIFYILSYAAGAWFPVIDVFELLKKKQLDVHFLMLCVAAGAAAIGHWSEGAVLLFLFSFSGALEDLAMSRTEREIQKLFKDTPREATVLLPGGRESRVPVEKLEKGMMLRVRPGEQFCADSEIIHGSSASNESSLTGESIPVEKSPGDTVFSGTLNLWGSVDCRVLNLPQESTQARIIKLIQEAQDSKAPAQKFTDRFGTAYTYSILGLSLAFFLWCWLVQDRPPFLSGNTTASAFYLSMTLLVVASPCALVLSIPSAILAGIASAARNGVLFRGGYAMELLAGINRVALDKTGTLTTGDLALEKIENNGSVDEAGLLQLAASLCHHSSHPVSKAIVKAARQKDLELSDISQFHATNGMGLEGKVTASGESIRVGRRSLFDSEGWTSPFAVPQPGVTEVFIACGPARGRILLVDSIRKSSAGLLKILQEQGLKPTMLTGDREESASSVATKLGLRDYKSGLKPEDKVDAIRSWQKSGDKVAMIGDGLNDAPCLATSDVAIAMGARGADASLEQADVILMKDRLEKVLYAYNLSRKARSIIKENLAISLGMILILVSIALAGKLPLTLGVLGHEGSTVVVVLNSLRLLFHKVDDIS